ncbi:MAG: hypothetical protein V4576_01850 [Patescibacteria group bacterium]
MDLNKLAHGLVKRIRDNTEINFEHFLFLLRDCRFMEETIHQDMENHGEKTSFQPDEILAEIKRILDREINALPAEHTMLEMA